MTPTTSQIIAAVIDALEAAGIRATADQRKLNPPAVLVGAPTIRHNRLAGSTSTIDLTAVVANTGRPDALDALGPLVAATTAVWPATYEFPVDVPSVAGGDPLPGRRLTCPIRAY
jgi:hypothetical protein